MTDHDKVKDDENLAHLFALAGKREEPEAAMRERVYAVALAEWRSLEKTERADEIATQVSGWRARRTALGGLTALAATLLVAVLFWSGQPVPDGGDGQLVYARGAFMIDAQRFEATGDVTQTIAVGQSLRTLSGGGLTAEISGAHVTLDANTRLDFAGFRQINLTAGRVYIDAAGAEAPLLVVTPDAQIVDIGTAYEVSVDPQGTRVAMREGLVQIDVADAQHVIGVQDGFGQVAVLDGGGEIQLGRQSVLDEAWQWRRALRAPFPLAGRSVFEYLDWQARDAGRTLTFASNAVAQHARLEKLGMGDFTSDQFAVEEVLEATDFVIRDVSGHVWQVDFQR